MYVVAFGLCVGSFLNVCIYRLPLQQDIVLDRSKCTNCGHVLQVLDLIPMLSYVLLKGRCRYCDCKVSIQYPLIEIITMCITLYIYYCYGIHLESICLLLIACLFIVISVIDMHHMLILDNCLFVFLLFTICYLYFTCGILNVEHLFGMGMISSLLYIMNFIKKDSFGMGDIKLYIVCGYLLGYQICNAFVVTLLLTTVTCIPLLIKKRTLKMYIPFAPFICLGCYIVLLFW